MTDWLTIKRGEAPLIISLPHTGTEIPADIEAQFVSPWLARKDTDWHIEKLYNFATTLGATVIRTAVSRSVIDVNRDPTGVSLYPGQNTTELCPTTTFDGEELYKNTLPSAEEIATRQNNFFEPYRNAITNEIARLKQLHEKIVVYDCHSIRSHIPRLFEGELPQFNIGTNDGTSCDKALTDMIKNHCVATGLSTVVNGRFKGGYITRHYGKPEQDVHAVQMELAIRGYADEPRDVNEQNWPPLYDENFAQPMRSTLQKILQSCIQFCEGT